MTPASLMLAAWAIEAAFGWPGWLYRLVRHPQYTGLFLVIAGQLVHWPTMPTVILSPIIMAVYVRLALREERRMTEKFGTDYLDYQRDVPRFFPRRGSLRELVAAG